MGTWAKALAGLALFGLTVACGSGDDGDDISNGTVQLGEECLAHADCAPIEGAEVRCRCTDAADTPVCDRLSNAGESCAITGSFQRACVEGMTCLGQADSDEALCVVPGAAGDDCSSQPCGEALSCSDESVCQPGTAEVGADCFYDGDCRAPLRCDFPFGCAAPIANGADCSGAGVPTARTCASGSACSGSSERCEPLKPDGADCFWDVECQAGECFFGSCGHHQQIDHSVHCGF
jgi:hypothetical protein